MAMYSALSGKYKPHERNLFTTVIKLMLKALLIEWRSKKITGLFKPSYFIITTNLMCTFYVGC